MEKGDKNMNTFQIAIYAIVALAIILLFLTQIIPYFTKNDTMDKITSGLVNAQISTNLGKTVNLGSLKYNKDFTLLAESFDKTKMLVSIECIGTKDCCPMKGTTTEKCTKTIVWNNSLFSISVAKGILTYVRCTTTQNFPLCKIYLDGTPAQAKISKIQMPTGGEKADVTLENSGSITLGGGTLTLQLYKKGPAGWEKTDYFFEPVNADAINPGEQITEHLSIAPVNAGEYRAEFTFSTQNAGFDTNSFDFNKTENTACIATTTGDTLIDTESGGYREMHNCTGCTYAYECAGAWEAKEPSKIYSPESADATFCIKQNYDANCQ